MVYGFLLVDSYMLFHEDPLQVLYFRCQPKEMKLKMKVQKKILLDDLFHHDLLSPPKVCIWFSVIN